MTEIDHTAIAALAHAIWVRRGRQPGHSIDDWLEAERQLRAKLVAEQHARAQAPAPKPAPPITRPAPLPAPAPKKRKKT